MRLSAYFALLLLISLILLPVSAFAEDATPSATTTITSTPSVANTLRGTVREKAKATVMQIKEDKAKLKLTIAQERSTFKQRLTLIKDERRKTVVTNLDAKINQVNIQRTTQMTTALNKMSELLTKIKAKGATAKQNGADTTSLDASIASAEAAIQTAQAAVTDQAAKQYTPSLPTTDVSSNSAELKTSIGSTISTLEADLRATHTTVITAQKAVHTAIMELAKVMKYVTKGDNTASSAAH